MCKFYFCTLVLWLSWTTLQAQNTPPAITPPSMGDFTGIQSFLSSGWMEGREAGARGGFLAADFIATMMLVNGLQPYGDLYRPIDPGSSLPPEQRSYFQNFELLRVQVEKSSLTLILSAPEGESSVILTPGIDYEINSVPVSMEAEAQVVFTGYGIESPGKGYDDYCRMDVRNRIVVILNGFPGYADTTSAAWKKLGKDFPQEFSELSTKLRIAEKHGAVAVIVIDQRDSKNPYDRSLHNQDVVNSAMNSTKPSDPEYEDSEYYIPGDTGMINIPCFILGANATRLLLKETGIDLSGFEKKAARDIAPASQVIKGKKIRLSVTVEKEAMAMRNVLGMVRGMDTNRYIIVGAHYDHLGTRKEVVYNGADDNASGVSGMLALSRKWVEYREKPSCNIIFAAWTAEEKGVLGSDYFAQHSELVPDKLSVVFNMDMISRSASEDTARRKISIGTLPVSEDLKNIARKSNAQLKHPFTLDLWDVTGHSGSDYGPFAARKIPVMTFFAGFHDDYHTPRDVVVKTDPGKMEQILKIVNDCIRETTENPPLR